MKKIKIYGTSWCGDTKRALKVFDERQIEFDWVDIDKDPAGENFVKETNRGYRSVPTIIFPDDTILIEPSTQVLNEKLDQLGY